MKRIAICLLLAIVPLRAAQPAAPATNVMVITSDGPAEYKAPAVVFRNNVRVTDSQMTMSCELLAIYFATNRPASLTNEQKLEMILAETNVVMTQGEIRITAGKAVYTATNELIVLSGNPVVETPQGVWRSTVFQYNRLQDKLIGLGGNVLSNQPGMNLFGTNTLGISLPGTKRYDRKGPGNTR